VCLLYRLDVINAGPKGNRYQLGQRGDEKYEDLKRIENRMPFFTECVQLQQMPHEGSSSRVWILAK